MEFTPAHRGRIWQWLHKKRWTYVAISDENVFAGMAVVSLSYAATAICFVLDRKTGELLVDRSMMGPGPVARFEDQGDGRRAAIYELGRTRMSLGDHQVSVDVPPDRSSRHPTHIQAIPTGSGPSPIAAIVPIDGGYANATEKRIVEVRGEIVVQNRRFVLDRAIAAFDHTAGFLARHTAWRWALGLGRLPGGERVAFNLVEGFVGESECAAWIGDTLYPVGEGRFEFDPDRPLEPWRVRTTCGSVDVRFVPRAIHAESKDLLLVRSRFIQPIGAYEGTLRLGRRTIEVRALSGVTEHQDVLW